MKKLITLFAFFAALFSAKAQTSIELTYASDSTATWMLCDNNNMPAYLYLEAVATGYSPSDQATFYINFGDGTDTTFSVSATFLPAQVYWAAVEHVYTSSGAFDVTYAVTMPDLNTDTVITMDDVIVGTCDTISGFVYDDNNLNCMFDMGDEPKIGKTVGAYDASTGLWQGAGITDANGMYQLLANSSATIEVAVVGSTPINYVCPISGILTTTAPSSDNNFAIDCPEDFDLSPVSACNYFRPGYETTLGYGLQNWFCMDVSPITLQLIPLNDPPITFVNAINSGGDPVPVISGDTLSWTLSSVFDYVQPTFLTSTTAPVGTPFYFKVIALPTTGDMQPLNNEMTVGYAVVNSLDPNYIAVSPVGEGTTGLIENNQQMTYTVHFQNTGTAEAINISISNIFESSKLNRNTFEFVASSHTVTNIYQNSDGYLAFDFDNINLPDSTTDEPNSHGWITYKIHQQPNLIPGTTIQNTAAIYFDFNSAVVTNTALNTIMQPLQLSESSTAENALQLYPVPASDQITVLTNSMANSAFQVIDINGKVLMHGNVSNGAQISVSGLAEGIYFFRLENGSVEKLIIHN